MTTFTESLLCCNHPTDDYHSKTVYGGTCTAAVALYDVSILTRSFLWCWKGPRTTTESSRFLPVVLEGPLDNH